MLGLIFAVIGYELDKFYDGSRGLKKIRDIKWTGSKPQLEAIKIRMESPGTNSLRILGAIANFAAILLLIWRHKLKINWLNEDYRVEMLIEEMKNKAIEFRMLDSDDDVEVDCQNDGHDHTHKGVHLNHEGGAHSSESGSMSSYKTIKSKCS